METTNIFPQVQEVRHLQIGQKYRLKLERAASTKGVIGYTIEVNGDDMVLAQNEIEKLKAGVEGLCPITVTEARVEGK